MPPAASQDSLQTLAAKVKAILPPQYRECYEDVSPVSMGSASLKFAADGRVAWDEMWSDFCDLALAGGPPHRGTYLEPCSPAEALAEEANYQEVVAEIGRGLWLVTGLHVVPRVAPGWIGVRCTSPAMAAWLQRAIVVENVMARRDEAVLFLPAGPHFRLEKEIKNVITAVAKTCHYWTEHMIFTQKVAITASLGSAMDCATLVEAPATHEIHALLPKQIEVYEEVTRGLERVGLPTMRTELAGWLGIPCGSEQMAIWMMRALVVEHVLARREEALLCLPLGPNFAADGQAQRLLAAVAEVFGLWQLHEGP